MCTHVYTRTHTHIRTHTRQQVQLIFGWGLSSSFKNIRIFSFQIHCRLKHSTMPRMKSDENQLKNDDLHKFKNNFQNNLSSSKLRTGRCYHDIYFSMSVFLKTYCDFNSLQMTKIKLSSTYKINNGVLHLGLWHSDTSPWVKSWLFCFSPSHIGIWNCIVDFWETGFLLCMLTQQSGLFRLQRMKPCSLLDLSKMWQGVEWICQVVKL